MESWILIGLLALVLLVVGLLWFGTSSSTGGEVAIVKGSQRGDTERIETMMLPIAYNQPQGLTYSYACWILVKNFTTGYGTRRRIFSRDDAPGVYLDSTSNSLVVAVDTFGTMETILIPNIPAKKWIHFALVVDQHSVDIYINGILRQHQTLSQLPKQTTAAVTIGSVWEGVLARLSYWPRSITSGEVKRLSEAELPDDLDREPSGPQYFDLTWYIGRLNSVQ